MKRHPKLWIKGLNTVKLAIVSKVIYRFDNSYQNYMEKAMAPYSSTLAWKIPWMEEPSRLQSMGSLRVGHD